MQSHRAVLLAPERVHAPFGEFVTPPAWPSTFPPALPPGPPWPRTARYESAPWEDAPARVRGAPAVDSLSPAVMASATAPASTPGPRTDPFVHTGGRVVDQEEHGGSEGRLMTFCVGLKCHEGLVALADTQLTTGTAISSAKKISIYQSSGHSLFVLTSGLRSVRDKAITYFQERLQRDAAEQSLRRVYQAANALAEEIRRVYREDESWLASTGLPFDLSTIIGGQMEDDAEHHLYLIYPQGNWIEVDDSTPYVVIGESAYGKPLLDRYWTYSRSLEEALRVGLLAFDATRTSSSAVGPPVDAVIYHRDSMLLHEWRFTDQVLAPLSDHWREMLNQAVEATSASLGPIVREALEPEHMGPPRR